VLRASEPAPLAPDDDPVCTLTEIGTCIQLTARGELDLAALPVLRDAAARAPLAAGRVVLLDLCNATFADSTVVHFAIELDARARAHGCELVIVARARTRELFTLVGASDLRVVGDGTR
jgi:anti-anti-sigma regulatory factor